MIRKVKSLLVVGSLILFACVATVNAEVYVVDIQKVLTESTKGIAAKKALEVKFQAKKKQLDDVKAKLVKQGQELQSQSSLLSKEALQKKVETVRRDEKQFSEELQKYQESFTRENNNKIGGILEEVQGIITKLAKDKSYSTIIEKNQRIVLYVDPKFDLTSEVLKRLNATN